MILEKIVRFSKRCAQSCAYFWLPSTARAARSVAVLLLGAGMCPEAGLVGVCVGCRRFIVRIIVCYLQVGTVCYL